MSKHHAPYYMFLAVTFMLYGAFWFYTKDLRPEWKSVPPPPPENTIELAAMGDKQFFFRVNALNIQNFGDIGGRVTPLKDYNFELLARWFFLMDKLDPFSDIIPHIAGYGFGASQDPSKIDPIIDYLAYVGQRSYGEKWRWMVQAIYLERFRRGDLDKALRMAKVMTHHGNPNMPSWARQMEVFVLAEKGEKEAAYQLMQSLIADASGKLPVSEIQSMKDYVCRRILEPDQAKLDPLCQEDN